MTKNRNINVLIEQCTAKLRAAGYNADRIKWHQSMWTKGICLFMKQLGETEYSSLLGKTYLECECKRLSSSTIKGRKRNIQILDEFMNYGTISSRIHDFCKYPIPKNEVGKIANDFFNYCALRGNKPLTITHHKRVVSLFLNSMTLNNVSDLTKLKAIDVIRFASVGKQPKQRLGSLRAFFNYVSEQKDLRVQHIVCGLYGIKFKQSEPLPSQYSGEEIQRIKNAINRYSPVGKRDYAVLILASDLGIRAGDIASLTAENINLSDKTINIVQQKTGEVLCLPMSEEIEESLVDYIDNVRPNVRFPELFVTAVAPLRPLTTVTINSIVRRAFSAAGINVGKRHFGTHSLRHSLASNLLAKGVSLPVISSILGHTSTATTMNYIRVDTEGLRDYGLDVPLVSTDFYEQNGGIFYERYII